MTGDAVKFMALTLVLAACLVSAEAGPCHSRPGAAAPVIVLAAGPGKHVIKAGDTVNVLALRFGVPAAAILKANPGLNPARLPLGKEIVIPQAAKAGAQAPSEPAVVVPSAPSPTPAPTGQGIELRPEKAPQATPLPTASPKGRDLPDAVAKPAPATASAASSPAEPAKESSAPPLAQEVPASKTVASTRPATTAPAAANWSMGAVWVLAGVVGIALVVALAMQGVFANLAAGLMLRVLRPFRPGDGVMLAGIAGRVEALGACYVAIRSEAGETVFVPNAKAAGEIVVVAKARVTNAEREADRS